MPEPAPPAFEALQQVRSGLCLQVLGYLDSLISVVEQRMRVPGFAGSFAGIDQPVHVVTRALRAKERRALEEQDLRGHWAHVEAHVGPDHRLPWDDQARERYRKVVLLASAGFGKSWLLAAEAHRLAEAQAVALREQTLLASEVDLPFLIPLPELYSEWRAQRKPLLRLVCRCPS